MGYAGLCSFENLQVSSDLTFHAGSIEQISNFAAGAGNCATEINTTPTNNNDPVITPIPDYTIPADTPFQLEGSASDVDPATVLTYQWDQMDAGTATTTANLRHRSGRQRRCSAVMSRRGIFVSRDFPSLGTQVRGLYDPAEVVPCQTRDVNLRLTVRDNYSGQASEDVRVSVTRLSGPFEVTSHSSPVTEASDFTVIWDVADTDLAPVNCPNVSIDLIAFDDSVYTNHSIHNLIASTPNDGSALISRPVDSLVAPARGRIRVKCSNNVFYAISQADVFIEGSNTVPQTFFDNNDNVTFAPDGTRISTAPECPRLSSGGLNPLLGGGGSGGSSAFDPWWLLLLVNAVARAAGSRC